MTTQRTSNSNARKLVDGLTEFEGSNTFAEIYPPCNKGTHSTHALLFTERPTYIYAVYSYGHHFPLYIAEWLNPDKSDIKWYENADRYSVSTSKHRSQLRPSNTKTTLLNTEDMKIMSLHGIAGVAVLGGKNEPRTMQISDMVLKQLQEALENGEWEKAQYNYKPTR